MKISLIPILVLIATLANGQNSILEFVKSQFKSENYAEVIKTVDAAINNNGTPDSILIELMHFKARSYGMIQDYDSSFYAYVDIYKRFPQDFHASLELGYRYGESGDYETAFYLFRNIRKYHPKEPSATVNLAYYNNEAGNYELSIPYSDTTLILAQDSMIIGTAWNNRCYSNIKLGNYSLAKEELEKSLNYYPNNSYAYRNKGLILLNENRTQEACEAFEQAKGLGGIYITEELRKKYCEG